MPKPASKTELLNAIVQERQALERLLAGLSPEQMLLPGALGEWSVKDVLAHLVEWEQMFLGWLAAGQRGETPALPAEGYNWRQLGELNQKIYEQYRAAPLDEILALFKTSFAQVCALLESLSEADLVTPGRPAWTGKHILIGFADANTANHYRWARQGLAKGLKKLGVKLA